MCKQHNQYTPTLVHTSLLLDHNEVGHVVHNESMYHCNMYESNVRLYEYVEQELTLDYREKRRIQ
jgi:hypothetical protein